MQIDMTDPRVQLALTAIDAGMIVELKDLIGQHPWLVSSRLHNEEEGYFKDPYLLWFVADNPIRAGKLPGNITEITAELVRAVRREAPDTYQYQIDYALELVASGLIPRECGVQIPMIDLLLDAGASPRCSMAALTNGNLEAAAYLIDRGDVFTLPLAVCLGRVTEIGNLIAAARKDEKITALAAAAYYGKEEMVQRLLETMDDPNGYPATDSGFHSHATALHQAVGSGSLGCVRLLVEAGARLDAEDKIHNGTAIGWADYLRRNEYDEAKKSNFSLIEDYLRSLN